MEPENNVLKWTAAAVGVIVVCFCLGYFVLGPSARTGPAAGTQIAEVTPDATPTAKIATPAAPPGGGLIVDERTDEIEAKKQKAADAAKKKADDAAKKKADEDAARKAAEGAAALAASPSPTPETSPSPDAIADPNAAPTPAETTPDAATPTPDTLYRVRVGSFASREAARGQAAELNGRGYATSIVIEKSDSGTTFRLQVGAYRDKKTAENIQKELRANGYDPTIDH